MIPVFWCRGTGMMGMTVIRVFVRASCVKSVSFVIASEARQSSVARLGSGLSMGIAASLRSSWMTIDAFTATDPKPRKSAKTLSDALEGVLERGGCGLAT